MTRRARHYGWEVALVGVAAVWGITFPIVKCALERCSHIRWDLGLASIRHPTTPFMFLSIRFALAAVIVGAFAVPALRTMTRRQLAIGLAIGVAMAGGFSFQTLGLHRTSASNTGFITGLYVVLTPLLGAVFLRRRPAFATMVAVVLSLTGLVLIASPSGVGLRLGDALVLGCAVSFAVHFLLLGRYASTTTPAALATIQLGVTAVATGILSLATERSPLPSEGGVWVAIAITGVLASAVAFVVQTGAQRFVPPTRTALILVMESPFAGLFGAVMLGDKLGARGWLGAGLIVCSMVVAELYAPAREEV